MVIPCHRQIRLRNNISISFYQFQIFSQRDGFFGKKKENLMDDDQRVNFFVSYCHKDTEMKEKLEEILKASLYGYNVEIWDDCEIYAGDDNRPAILGRLKNADIVLLLVSTNFINSTYCMNKEVSMAIDRMKHGRCKVIPVILSECILSERLPFFYLERVPKDGQPIDSYKAESGYYEASRMIKRSLDALMNQRKADEVTDRLHIDLVQDGTGVKHVEVDQFFMDEIPSFMEQMRIFSDKMIDLLRDAEGYIDSLTEETNPIYLQRFEARGLKAFLNETCSYTKEYITGDQGFRVHFRGLCNDNYIGLAVCTRNGRNDEGVEFSSKITPIPASKGLIYYSQRAKKPLLKSLNSKINYETNNNSSWTEYLTYSLNNLTEGKHALLSFGIAVYKDYHEYYKNSVDTLFYLMAYAGFAELVSDYVKRYYDYCICKISSYDLEKIIEEQF